MGFGHALGGDERGTGPAVEGGDHGGGEIGQRIGALLPAGGDGGEDAFDVAVAGAGLGAEGAAVWLPQTEGVMGNYATALQGRTPGQRHNTLLAAQALGGGHHSLREGFLLQSDRRFVDR